MQKNVVDMVEIDVTMSLRRPQNLIVNISTYIEIAKVDEIMTIVQLQSRFRSKQYHYL